MPKYLLQVSYTAEGTKGLLKDGGTKRRAVAEAALKNAGGSLDAFYYAFGDVDVYTIVEAPDNAAIASAALAINASGAVTVKTVALLTPEEIDRAAKQAASSGYTPPGR
jgi:uncharacterized protein with GYD domain